jgi:hypothetical protein
VLNEHADARQFVAITLRVNGGTNGLADRRMYCERAKALLGADAGAARGHQAIAAVARNKKTPARR